MHDETMASGVYLPELDVIPARDTTEVHRLRFHGHASDYFRIWIVNVALSLVTLGIYSAWATVRTRRYMYANTTLGGSPFDYLARPLPILKGRLLTVAIFAIYVLAGRIAVPLQGLAALVVATFMPCLIVKSMMFRARYSSWRGLRFFFSEDYMGAYKWYLGVYFLMAIPFILYLLTTAAGHPGIGILLAFAGFTGLYPWIKGHQQEWMVENHHFGGKSFRFDSEIGNYYGVYIKAAGVALAWFVPCLLLFSAVAVYITKGNTQAFNPKMPSPYFLLGTYATMAPAYLGVWTFAHTRMTNLLYNQAQLGLYRFRSTLEYWPMLSLYLTNALAVLFSIGLALPWARIRMARYRAEHLEVIGEGDLSDFVRDAFAHGEIGATATEMDSLLGIDIGL
ncbi:YjgN family protein [Dyella amyloliquefaciens]|uniref:YjgN family protein n=1 Tax=Dyella amyloliquefaciens TaxID=1770545 RepID=UPI0013EED24E|nr:YjgN family protein [Dyella amyloliquefaciens]